MSFISSIKDLLSILAVVIPTGYAIYLWFRSKRGDISWRALQKAVKKLHRIMEADSYRPDHIVCIGRAGSIVGAMLSHTFGSPVIPMMVLTFDYQIEEVRPDRRRGREFSRREHLLESCAIPTGLQNVLVLGIDIMTGSTMKAGIQELTTRNAEHTATACLFWNENAGFKPTYYCEQRDRRLIYPWMADSFNRIYNIGKRTAESDRYIRRKT